MNRDTVVLYIGGKFYDVPPDCLIKVINEAKNMNPLKCLLSIGSTFEYDESEAEETSWEDV